MTDLENAKKIICDDDEKFINWVEAAGVICGSSESTFDDLLLCLKRQGVPSEVASIELHNRSGRPRNESGPKLITSIADWKEYFSRGGKEGGKGDKYI